ncbi:MAG TPA: glycoside hydrolase family 3 N-terminal domain-containing protein [Nocardioidaceae bacterium]|nr:glycoside hydrolase family 3 N-terminal domain-containing protein [Nocardioidaceae bacterium]
MSAAASILDGMSLAQQVGQVFMVGGPATGVGSATLAEISTYHIGSVILTGRSYSGLDHTRLVTQQVQAAVSRAATDRVPELVAADQEGGDVQVLQGPGFSAIPTALTQGTWSPAYLAAQARGWGQQLRAAGVNLDLAPVMDTVPVGFVNPPIGEYDREYGHTPAVVAAEGTAFERGVLGAGVGTTLKHFPGLGRVDANTDTTAGVTDYVTTYDDPYLAPFRAGVDAGTPFVMMSTAYYQRIDPGVPAAFSSRIIGGMLRGELGFHGVVISDSLGATQVDAWAPANRALDFLSAGGNLALVTVPSLIPPMYDAVYSRAKADPAFRSLVRESALRVLQAKQRLGLLAGLASGAGGSPTIPPPTAPTTAPVTTTPTENVPTTATASTAPSSPSPPTAGENQTGSRRETPHDPVRVLPSSGGATQAAAGAVTRTTATSRATAVATTLPSWWRLPAVGVLVLAVLTFLWSLRRPTRR